MVQYILDQKVPWATIKILDQLEGHYRTLSVQKYSSNVVEKCLKYAGDARRVNIIRELIDGPHFVQISLDPYGNYVIQSAHRECKVDLIKPDCTIPFIFSNSDLIPIFLFFRVHSKLHSGRQ